MTKEKLLKKDLFGEVWVLTSQDGRAIVRDTAPAPGWTRWLARALLRREARVLRAVSGIADVPRIERVARDRLERAYIDGAPMQEARPEDPAFFRAAARLLRRLHAANVVHNDLAKEPNILVQPSGRPAFIDFQLAWAAPRRNALFRLLAYEDLRHLLKHKRTYCPQELTARERQILSNPSLPSRAFRRTVKPLYLLITRRLLGWSDREGAADRGRLP